MKTLLTLLLVTVPTLSNASVDLEPVKTLNAKCIYLVKDVEGWSTGTAFSLEGEFKSLQDVPDEVVVMYNNTELVIKVSSCDVEMK